jgi:MFS family permease
MSVFTPPATARRVARRRLYRPVAFWTAASTVAVLLAASSAASPLYAVYQQAFGFSTTTLTVIFAAYVLALLVSLLTVGRLSDHVGRRPVLAAALLVEAVAMIAFLAADGVGWLFLARSVQGLATGAAAGVLAAYLLDLQPANRSRLGSLANSVAPMVGLAAGAVGSGLLVQYGPAPTKLVFVVLLVLSVVLAALVWFAPETVRRSPGTAASLLPRVAVPRAARAAFLGASPAFVATWALGGLFLSVGASVLHAVFGVSNIALAGLILGVFAASGALASLAARNAQPAGVVRIGTGVLVIGALAEVAALATSSLALFVAGAVVSGAGFGSTFLGAFRAVSQLAEPHERAGLVSAVYVVCYLGFSLPAIVAGELAVHVGLRPTAIGYGLVVAALALATLLRESAVAARRASARRPCETLAA